jgi:hypothetical protein
MTAVTILVALVVLLAATAWAHRLSREDADHE